MGSIGSFEPINFMSFMKKNALGSELKFFWMFGRTHQTHAYGAPEIIWLIKSLQRLAECYGNFLEIG